MQLTRAEVKRHRGRLLNPARNARQQWIERQGLIVTLVDESGGRGHGEASPLPGYSPDTLRSCADALDNLDVTGLDVDPEAPLATQLAQCSATLPPHCPAARFALECAVADLVGRRTGRPLWALLDPNASAAQNDGARRLTTLVDAASPATVRDAVSAAVDRGVTSFKLKIGRPNAWALELGAIEVLRAAAGPSAALRLDANGSLPPQEAPQRLRKLAAFDPEFVEEPTCNVWQVAESPVALALDESLHNPTAAEQLESRSSWAPITTLVLKPMALGGISVCLEWARTARRLGLRVVLSHLLDGPIALGACSHLALVLNSPDIPTGLDHHAGLHAWPRASVGTMTGGGLGWSTQPGLGVTFDPGSQP
jgi:o-succinylbenzoate synthase